MYDHQHHLSHLPTGLPTGVLYTTRGTSSVERSSIDRVASRRRAGVEASRRRGLMLRSIASAFLASRCRGGVEMASSFGCRGSVEVASRWRRGGVKLASSLASSWRRGFARRGVEARALLSCRFKRLTAVRIPGFCLVWIDVLS